jgi:hypothetical protein
MSQSFALHHTISAPSGLPQLCELFWCKPQVNSAPASVSIRVLKHLPGLRDAQLLTSPCQLPAAPAKPGRNASAGGFGYATYAFGIRCEILFWPFARRTLVGLKGLPMGETFELLKQQNKAVVNNISHSMVYLIREKASGIVDNGTAVLVDFRAHTY